MIISAQEVANKIIGSIEKQVEQIQTSTNEKSTAIEIEVHISKDQLRVVGQRRHIRGAFLKEVAGHINDQGYDAQIVNGALTVMDEKEADPEILLINSI